MEDIRTYGREEDEQWHTPDDERLEEWSAASEDEPPYHIPRD
jgi:hypothetical protein